MFLTDLIELKNTRKMKTYRRDFLKMTCLTGAGILSSWIGIAKALNDKNEGTENPNDIRIKQSPGFNMSGYRAPKIETVRIGFIGIGNRGTSAVKRINFLDGVHIKGLCDIREEKATEAKRGIKGFGHEAALYTENEESWKKLCERKDIDLIYICTPWNLHAKMAVYAMEQGKHVAVEVPAVKTIEEAWQLVETSEKYKRHCVMLENCCYDFFELLTLNMVRQGLFGEIVHCEGAYIHDIGLFKKNKRYDYWRVKENASRNGNLYPTHGVGPVCQLMNINRGNKLDYLISISSNDFMLHERAKKFASRDDYFNQFVNKSFRGNMNTSVIKTHNGSTIMVQHDVTSPRPYSRIHLISGTKATAQKYPLPEKLALEDGNWLSEEKYEEVKKQYSPAIIEKIGGMALKVGGHGGMDFMMDWRLIDCLRNGLAVDIDAYDAATWSVVAPLSEWSVAHHSAPIEVPDFTRGGWKTNMPHDISLKEGVTTGVRSRN